MKFPPLGLVLVALLFLIRPAWGDSFLLNNGTFTTLSVPGALPHSTDAVAINDSGQIVGFFTDSTGNHGFLYTNGVFTTLPGLATGINNEGQIVGVVSLLGDCNCGFLDTNGVFSTIDFPGSLATEPLGINSAGQIVGSVYFNNFGNVSSFIDTNGRFTRITLPFSYLFDEGQGINDSSQIVGSYFTATGGHGFLDSNGVFSSINVPFLGAYGTYAYGINDSGQIVGLFTTNTSTPLNGFLDTGGVYTTIDVPGASETLPTGINGSGEIVGTFLYKTAVPEPTSLMLLASGLAALGFLTRRKAEKANRDVH